MILFLFCGTSNDGSQSETTPDARILWSSPEELALPLSLRTVSDRLGRFRFAIALFRYRRRERTAFRLRSRHLPVFGNDTSIPRPTGRRHPTGDQERENGRQVKMPPALAEIPTIDERGLMQVAGDGHGAAQNVEQDVPLS